MHRLRRFPLSALTALIPVVCFVHIGCGLPEPADETATSMVTVTGDAPVEANDVDMNSGADVPMLDAPPVAASTLPARTTLTPDTAGVVTILDPNGAAARSAAATSATAAAASAAAAAPRCEHLDVCEDGAEVVCPDGTDLAGEASWTCLLTTERDPSTGEECESFTWYYLGSCNYQDEEGIATNGSRYYQAWVDSHGGVHFRTRVSGGSWSASVSLGGSVEGLPAIGFEADGGLTVLVKGAGNHHLYRKHRSAFGTWDAHWTGMGGTLSQSPVLARNHDGRLEAFVVGSGGGLYHLWQTTPSGAWTGFHSLGGIFDRADDWGRPSVIPNRDGRLEFFGITTGHNVYHKWQTTVGGSWTADWAALGGDRHADSFAAFRVNDLGGGYLKVTEQGYFDGDLHMMNTYIRYQEHPGWSAWQYCANP